MVEARQTSGIHPVILSGGVGERLWPASRSKLPKQFLPLVGNRSTFQAAVLRVLGRPGFAEPMVVCNADHRFLVAQQLAELGATARIVVEPVRRDSGPAIAVAARLVAEADPQAMLFVQASDHRVEEGAAFEAALSAALAAAAGDRLVVFGIRPNAPSTAYGYIRPGAALDDALRVLAVERFVEKPGAAEAERFRGEGYLWNSGNLVFRAGVFLAELERHAPEMARAVARAVAQRASDIDFVRLDETAFAEAPQISVDYAVMEKTDRAAVVAAEFAWSDLGSWAALWGLEDHDARGNVTHGDALVIDAANCYVRADSGQLVAVTGVTDIAVVATRDAVLVAPRDGADGVRRLVGALQDAGRREVSFHPHEERPWGCFETVERGEGYLVKRISVKPGGRLSLQRHKYRAEQWVVVTGTATATINGKVSRLQRGQSISVPRGAVHRIENETGEPLEIVEVQLGEILTEDDIERLEDIYGRS